MPDPNFRTKDIHRPPEVMPESTFIGNVNRSGNASKPEQRLNFLMKRYNECGRKIRQNLKNSSRPQIFTLSVFLLLFLNYPLVHW